MSEFDEKTHYLSGIQRSRRMAIIFVVLAVVIGAIGAQFQNRGMPITDKPPTARIEYAVTGTSQNVRIIYLNDLAYRNEKIGTPPWKFGFRANQGRTLEVQVDNLTQSGTIGCEIRAFGKAIYTVAESTDATITCAAVVP
ncbi:MAG: hypothetical protein RLY87_971 [Chloroflexota bacterium]|jgi:hypothetical protein